MIYTCIVIDDEPYVVQQLIEYINEMPTLRLVKSYTDSSLALKEILGMKGKIDILFTDIEMPNFSGMDLAEKIKDKVSFLVFVSGHSEYAIKSFSLNVKDFLLKPFDFKKFENLVLSAISRLKNEPAFISLKTKEDKTLTKIYFEEIIFIEAKGNYIQLYTHEKLPLMISNLAEIEERLKQHPNFAKIHKSYIVSLKHIDKSNGDYIWLKNGLSLSVGQNYKNKIATYLVSE